MAHYQVNLEIVIKARGLGAARGIAYGAADHLRETFNDDESIEALCVTDPLWTRADMRIAARTDAAQRALVDGRVQRERFGAGDARAVDVVVGRHGDAGDVEKHVHGVVEFRRIGRRWRRVGRSRHGRCRRPLRRRAG